MKITPLKYQKSPFEISYNDELLFLGSCFSDAIGGQLEELKFKSLVNPFGTVFNPVSIEKLLKCTKPDQNRMVQLDDVYLHLDYHSTIFAYNQKTMFDTIEQYYSLVNNKVQTSDFIFITLGTAWVYEFENEVVNNCHKQNPEKFTHRLLELKEIEDALNRMIKHIKSLNEKSQIIFTISPVRHIKNGLVENNLSKSLLNVALNKVLKSKGASYFPAYEIVMDELRDYKYFEQDGIHPNHYATELVFKVFSEMYFSEKTKDTVRNVVQLLQRERHRFNFPESKKAIAFKTKFEEDLKQFLDSGFEGEWNSKIE